MLQEGNETSILAIGVPLRIRTQRDEMHIALLVPALERIERGRTIVQPGMHQRMCVGGDVSSARRLFQPLQRVERFAAPTYLGEEIAAERMQLAVVGAGRQLSVEDL